MKKFYLLCFTLLAFGAANAQTNTYAASTTNFWSTAANWSLGHIPAAGEDVVIPASSVVTIDVTTIPATTGINSLTVSGSLIFSVTTARTITVTNDVTINAGGSFSSAATGTVTTHKLSVGGNNINSGSLDFSTNSNTAGASVTFTGSANQMVSGTGTITDLSLVTMSKTALDITAATNTVELNLSNFTVKGLSNLAAGFLPSAAGTGLLKISGTNTFNGNVWNAAVYSLPATLGFWLNNPNFTVNAQSNVTLSGMLRISNGTYNIGTANNNLLSGAGTTIIEGGMVNVSAKYQVTGPYTQTGGTLTTAIVGNNSSASASFQASGSFTMSGGTIVLQNKSTGATQLDYNVSTASPVISGGTLQIGNSATPAGSSFNIQGKTPSLVLDNSSGNNPGIALSAAATVLGDITLNGSGTFSKSTFALTVQGNAANTGNITVNGTNNLILNGSAATALSFTSSTGDQVFSLGSGTIAGPNQLPSLTINNTLAGSLVTIPTGLTIINAGTLTLTSGVLNTALLTMGTSAATTLAGGSSASYINGALVRTFLASRTAVGTYSALTLFPVGRNGVYFPVYLDPSTSASGIAQLKAEAFDSNMGSNISVSGTVSQHRWEIFAVSGGANLTNLFLRQNDALIGANNKIIEASSSAGIYQSISPATVFAASLLTSGTAIPATEFLSNSYYSFGDACNPLPNINGPSNICKGAVSQFYPTAGINVPATGTWGSSASGIAAVDAAGNVTAVSPGTATISFTINAADGCNGLQATKLVNISNCSITPGGVGNNLISWYKADAGLSGSSWIDQTGNNNLSAFGAPAASATVNFNPAANFGGVSDYYGNAGASGWNGFTTGTTFYYVATSTAGTGNSQRMVYGRGVSNGVSVSAHGGRWNTSIFSSGNISTAPFVISPTWVIQPSNLSRSGFNGGAGANYYVNANGGAEVPATPATPVITGQAPFYIGRAATVGSFWLGSIAEVIAFNGKQNSTDYNQVESYLAFKYGISMVPAQDYTASDGSTKIWTAAAASSFTNNIFGLGRDAGSGLDQRIAVSVTEGNKSILTVTSGDAVPDFTSANGGIRTQLADKQFLAISNNGGTANWTTTAAPSGFGVLNKQWQVQNTGNVTGPINVQFDVANTNFDVPVCVDGSTNYYLVSGNGSVFNTPILLTKNGNLYSGSFIPAGSAGGTTVTTFTLACKTTIFPGGVGTDIAVWLRADSISGATNNSPVGSWNNITVGFTAPTQTVAANKPTWLDGSNTTAVNHNPVMSFNGTSSYMQFSDMLFTNNFYTAFAVVNNASIVTPNSFHTILGPNVGSYNAWGYDQNGAILQVSWNNLTHNVSFNGIVNANGLHAGLHSAVYGGAAGDTIGFNAKILNTSNVFSTNGFLPNTQLGGGFNGFNLLNGTISELVMFDNAHMNSQSTQQVQSYLAFKYGIMLDEATYSSYLASDGSFIWSASNNTTGFIHNVFGIGLDNTSRLDQRISTPANMPWLTVSTDADFNLTNAAHAALITTDKNFEVFADNAGALTWTSANGMPDGFKRLTKEWQVQETGTVGGIYLQFNVDDANADVPALLKGNTYYMAIDPNNDGDYSDASIVTLTNTNGSNWATSAPIDFHNGDRFTLATLSTIDAGQDLALCTDSSLSLTITGRSPMVGPAVWSAAPGNPSGQLSLSGTVDGVATVTYNAGTKGFFNYVYSIGGETDTMTVTVGPCQVPGNISSNLWLWFKGDQGMTANGSNQVMHWDNQAAANIITQAKPSVVGPDVTYNTSGINYNPTVSFSGANNDKAFLQGLMGVTPTQVPAITYAVFKGGGGTLPAQWIFCAAAQNGAISMNNTNTATPSIGADANGGAYGPFIYSAASANIVAADYQTNALTNTVVRLNGAVSAAGGTGTPSYYPGSGDFFLGARFDVVTGGFHDRIYQGEIAEVLYYVDNNNQSAFDAIKIESSLALKYGITLNKNGASSGNYLLSNNTKVWDANSNPTYHRDVIGIVRDDKSGLLQKQSRTTDDSLRVFAGVLASSNKNNTGTVSNDFSSIVIGNDGGKLRSVKGVSKPVTVFTRLQRVWKVTNTNFADNFGIEIKWDSIGNFNISDIRLLVSDSPDFTSAAVYGTHDVNFYIGSIIVTGISNAIIPMNSTKFITIGSATTFTTLDKDLLQFDATATAANKVNLQWQTAAASNTDYFTVERSADKNSWQSITTVNASGNVMVPTTYNSIDTKPYAGVSYYRLKLTNADGKYSYSPVRAVVIDQTTNKNIIVYPNPVVNQLTIKGDPKEIITIKLFNMMGQDMTSLVRKTEVSNTTVLLDVSRLISGAYTVKTDNTVTRILKK